MTNDVTYVTWCLIICDIIQLEIGNGARYVEGLTLYMFNLNEGHTKYFFIFHHFGTLKRCRYLKYFLMETNDRLSYVANVIASSQGTSVVTLQWRFNERDGISNLDCLLNDLFMRRSKKTSKLHVTRLCQGNPPMTSGFPSHRASNADHVSIWLRHYGYCYIALQIVTILLRRCFCDSIMIETPCTQISGFRVFHNVLWTS